MLCFRDMHCATRAGESFRLQVTESLLERRDLFACDFGQLAEVKKEGRVHHGCEDLCRSLRG